MTNIDRIISKICKGCSCDHCWDMAQLAGHIKLLDKLLAESRAENERLKERTANFERLRDNFKKYREEHP